MTYSIRQMAAALGVSKSQVARDAKAGMPMQDLDAARAWRIANQDLTRTAEGRIDRTPTHTSRPPSLDIPTKPDPDTDPDEDPLPAAATTDKDTAAYRSERAQREAIRRQREQLELEQLRNELVAVQEVSRLQFTAQRLTRDRVEMVAARAAPEVVALVQSGGDGFAIERLITGHLRQALEDAAKAIEEIDDDEDSPD
jgi:transcriptional regulator with XRE-family HTH domain